MKWEVVTLFPEMFQSFLAGGLLGKAIADGLVEVAFTNPRDFATDRHRSVDDAPYGGGVGMVMRVEPLCAAVEAAVAARGPAHRVLLSPAGKPLTQARVRELAARPRILLVCGRYEGIDERVRELCIDEELSIGDFVLMGGEVAAMAIIDAACRFVPGVLGDPRSTDDESFSAGLLEAPAYTRPPEFRGLGVPDVMVSGHHEKIRAWKQAEALARTARVRPELLAGKKESFAARAYVVLLHHPVLERTGRVVTTAVTNLDVHDIARASKTYGLAGYFVVTPIAAQRKLVEEIIGHWTIGPGREHEGRRTDALELVRVVPALEDAVAAVRAACSETPVLVATGARPRAGVAGYGALRAAREADPRPTLLLFGTGWGLAEAVFEAADHTLAPIDGPPGGQYNHLSVRAAVAIVLDRLFGRYE